MLAFALIFIHILSMRSGGKFSRRARPVLVKQKAELSLEVCKPFVVILALAFDGVGNQLGHVRYGQACRAGRARQTATRRCWD